MSDIDEDPVNLSGEALANLADQFWEVYQERLSADKVAAALKEREVKLSELLIHQMRFQKMTSVGGQLVRLSINTVPDYVPTIQDYTAFAKFILETKDLSLLEKRVSKSAVKEHWENGEEVPGIVKFPTWKLSKSKVQG
jgi:hypothetical protein